MGFERGKGGTVAYGKDKDTAHAPKPARKPAPKPADVPAEVLELRKAISAMVDDGSTSVQEIADVKEEFGFGADDRVIESTDVDKLTALLSYLRTQTTKKGGAQ
jgi:hypothetical protein